MSKSATTDNSGPTELPRGRRLRLAVDATAAARERTGIGHYTASMLAALAGLDGVEVLPFTYGLRSTRPLQEAGGQRPAHLGLPGKLLLLGWHHLRWPRVDALAPGAEAVFSPNYLVLPTRRPLLVTVHDLYFLDGPTQDHWSGAFLAAHLRRHLARRAALVLADSKATRQRLLERVPGLEGRVEVVYPGLRERYFRRASEEAREATRLSLGLPGEYLLCVGDLSPRKNQMALLEACRRSGAGQRPPIVFCGLSEPGRRLVLRRAEELGLGAGTGKREVFALPYLEDEQLHSLVSGAHAVLCPSLDEGFGLVVLEALSVGVPVSCSETGSLPEVAGGLALQFDPRDPDAMAEALLRISGDEELRGRQQAGGPGWAARFRYEDSARRLVDLAQEVLRAGRP